MPKNGAGARAGTGQNALDAQQKPRQCGDGGDEPYPTVVTKRQQDPSTMIGSAASSLVASTSTTQTRTSASGPGRRANTQTQGGDTEVLGLTKATSSSISTAGERSHGQRDPEGEPRVSEAVPGQEPQWDRTHSEGKRLHDVEEVRPGAEPVERQPADK